MTIIIKYDKKRYRRSDKFKKERVSYISTLNMKVQKLMTYTISLAAFKKNLRYFWIFIQ